MLCRSRYATPYDVFRTSFRAGDRNTCGTTRYTMCRTMQSMVTAQVPVTLEWNTTSGGKNIG